jgi:DNA-binding protein HU-beta
LILLAGIVTKKDLVGRIAVEAQLTRGQATRALEACIAGIQASLQRGDRVTISGFGTFAVLERKARRVRNPRNGGDMQIAARRVPRFAPGTDLKSAIDKPGGTS